MTHFMAMLASMTKVSPFITPFALQDFGRRLFAPARYFAQCCGRFE